MVLDWRLSGAVIVRLANPSSSERREFAIQIIRSSYNSRSMCDTVQTTREGNTFYIAKIEFRINIRWLFLCANKMQ